MTVLVKICAKCGASQATGFYCWYCGYPLADNHEWTQKEAIDLCCLLEPLFAEHGWHVALTGGCLYKPGSRKDCDLFIYPHRKETRREFSDQLIYQLKIAGFKILTNYSECLKCTYNNKPVDLLIRSGETYKK